MAISTPRWLSVPSAAFAPDVTSHVAMTIGCPGPIWTTPIGSLTGPTVAAGPGVANATAPRRPQSTSEYGTLRLRMLSTPPLPCVTQPPAADASLGDFGSCAKRPPVLG